MNRHTAVLSHWSLVGALLPRLALQIKAIGTMCVNTFIGMQIATSLIDCTGLIDTIAESDTDQSPGAPSLVRGQNLSPGFEADGPFVYGLQI